ncbi:MAG: VCBS repeat-containing protein [Deltaproteobacteria bacterium]|nr:VCBS repeat-containing protein [Deltaproteobacteria bacterium]
MVYWCCGSADIAISGPRGEGGGVALYVGRDHSFERVGILGLATRAGGLAVGDFNSDGFDDIAVATIGGIAVFESR